MRIAALGNYSVDYSTESHVTKSMELLGHEVVRIQEGETPAASVPRLVEGCGLFWHTQTYGLALSSGTLEERHHASESISIMGIPRVFFHLDLFHSLPRVESIRDEPWTRYDYVFTADGGHQAEWEAMGVNHHWLPPGVFGPDCYIADVPIEREIVFVGSWRGGYHPESKHRFELVKWLARNYRRHITFYPKQGQPAVRGDALNRLYASSKIAIGDSCMVPELRAYASDRCVETPGRFCTLFHPHVDGIFPELLESGKHCVTWTAYNWGELKEKLDYYLSHDAEREEIRRAGHEHVKKFHTYEHRVQTVLETIGMA